jgi:hypothetical protein
MDAAKARAHASAPSWHGVLAAMCALLWSAQASARAQEGATPPPPPPRWQITYRAIPGLAPPEPIASWWRALVVRESLRWRPLTGWGGDAAAWVGPIEQAGLVVETRHRQDRPGNLGALSGWCRGGPSAAALAALAGAWSGRSIAEGPDGVELSDPGLACAHALAPPGWRIQLDQASLHAFLGAVRDDPTYVDASQVLSVALQDGVTIRIREPSAAEWTLGPAALSRPLDARRLAELPDGLDLSCAIGIDGAAVGAAYDQLRSADARAQLARDELARLQPARPQPARKRRPRQMVARRMIALAAESDDGALDIVRAIDGTVLIGESDDGDLVVSLPRSAALDAALARHSPDALTIQDNAPRAFEDACLLRTPDSWLFAKRDEAFARWRAPSRAAPSPTPAGAWCVATVGAGTLAQVIAADGQEGLELTDGLHGRGVGGGAISIRILASDAQSYVDSMGRSLLTPIIDASALEAALRSGGATRIVGTIGDGRLKLAVSGAIATWLPVGVALRAARDAIFHDCAMRLLVDTIARLHRAGRGPGAADPSWSQMQPEWQHGRALTQRVLSLSRHPAPRSASAGFNDYCAHDAGRAILPHAAQVEVQVAELLAATAPLDDPRLPSIATLVRQDDVGHMAGATQQRSLRLAWQMSNLRCFGASMVATGDLRGLALIARADRLLDDGPDGSHGSPFAPTDVHGEDFDRAVFAAADLGLLSPDEATALMAHRLPRDGGMNQNPWRWYLDLALDCSGTRPNDRDDMLQRLDPCASPADIAAALAAASGLGCATPVLVSRLDAMWLSGAQSSGDAEMLSAALSHNLLRRGLALMLVARAGRLPVDDRGVAAATGPPQEVQGPCLVRVRLLRYHDGGFQLHDEIDDASDPLGNFSRYGYGEQSDQEEAMCARNHFFFSERRLAWHPFHPAP